MRENKASSSGVREARRDVCAAVRADWGRSSKCCERAERERLLVRESGGAGVSGGWGLLKVGREEE